MLDRFAGYDPNWAVYEGDIVYKVNGLSRKQAEADVKEARKALEALLTRAAAVSTGQDTLVLGEVTLYLSPKARLARGKAMRHCLGAALGGPGHHYIAAGYKEWTWGFFLDPFQFDMVKGPSNQEAPPDIVALTPRVTHLVKEYGLPLATWDCAEDLSYYLDEARARLAEARRKEHAVGVFSGRLSAPIMGEYRIDRSNGDAVFYFPPEDHRRMRDWLVLGRELGAVVRRQKWSSRTRRPSLDHRSGHVLGFGWPCGQQVRISHQELDHVDEELAELSSFHC